MIKVREDITGWIMKEHGIPDSKLTVVRRAEDAVSESGYKEAQYLCRCECEDDNYVVVRARYLRNGHTLSCGCVQKEMASKYKKKYNTYDLSGEYGIGWTLNTNKEFYFDLEDYDKIKEYCWSETSNKNNDYHRLEAYDKTRNKNIAMHYLIKGKYCDHIDHNPLNNRRLNLRLATMEQNGQNISIYKNNKSGVIGVGWSNERNKWRAYIKADNKHLHIGYFDNKDDAIRARLNAENKYFGEFAPQQHLYERYGVKKTEE
jgi:hypothetical protein